RSDTPTLFPYTTLFRSPAGIEEREEGPDGEDVAHSAAAGDRGGFRPGDLWPGAQEHAESELGSDEHDPGNERRGAGPHEAARGSDRKSTRLNSSHVSIS